MKDCREHKFQTHAIEHDGERLAGRSGRNNHCVIWHVRLTREYVETVDVISVGVDETKIDERLVGFGIHDSA